MDFDDLSLYICYAVLAGIVFLLVKVRWDKYRENNPKKENMETPVYKEGEDARIAEICSNLDDVCRTLKKPAWTGAIIAFGIAAYAAGGKVSPLGRFLFFSAGCALLLASWFVASCSERCIHIMTKVMRYYTETKSAK